MLHCQHPSAVTGRRRLRQDMAHADQESELYLHSPIQMPWCLIINLHLLPLLANLFRNINSSFGVYVCYTNRKIKIPRCVVREHLTACGLLRHTKAQHRRDRSPPKDKRGYFLLHGRPTSSIHDTEICKTTNCNHFVTGTDKITE
jgi:hypothetical protein